MKHISSFDAKTHLSSLLSNVMSGQGYIITRHNRQIAKLVPCTNVEPSELEEVIKNIKSNRVKLATGIADIVNYRSQGGR